MKETRHVAQCTKCQRRLRRPVKRGMHLKCYNLDYYHNVRKPKQIPPKKPVNVSWLHSVVGGKDYGRSARIRDQKS